MEAVLKSKVSKVFQDFEMFYMKKKFNDRLQNEIRKRNQMSKSSIIESSNVANNNFRYSIGI